MFAHHLRRVALRSTRVLLLVAGTLFLSAHAPASVDTLTRLEAEKLTVEQLARRVLGMTGASIREARVAGESGPTAFPLRLAAIEFTTGGRQGGNLGLCTAPITTVRFHAVNDADRTPDPPSIADDIEVHPLWSLLPEPAVPGPDFLKAYDAERPLCAARTPVLTDDGAWFRATWNGQRDLLAKEASFAADLLRRLDRPDTAVRSAARCGDAAVQGCPDAPRALTRIDMLRPAKIDLAPCPGSKRVCATIDVERQGNLAIAGEYTQVKVETDAETPVADAPRIRSVTLSRGGWVV